MSSDTLEDANTIYREVYAEPPYLEHEAHFSAFADDIQQRAKQPNFRLAIARLNLEPVGLALGHRLTPETRWWQGAEASIADDVMVEYPGRTFAVIELAVRQQFRRLGLGRRLHSQLTTKLPEERVTLLVRPDAGPALAAYSGWSYEPVGRVRPYETSPVYLSMVRRNSSARHSERENPR